MKSERDAHVDSFLQETVTTEQANNAMKDYINLLKWIELSESLKKYAP